MTSESPRQFEITVILDDELTETSSETDHWEPKPHVVYAVLGMFALVGLGFASFRSTEPSSNAGSLASHELDLSGMTTESIGLAIYRPNIGLDLIGLDGRLIDTLEAPTDGGIAALADRVIYVGDEQAWLLMNDGTAPTPMGEADLVIGSRSTDLVWLGSFRDDTDIGQRGPSDWQLIDIEGNVRDTKTIAQLPRPFPSPGLTWFTTGMSRLAESDRAGITYTVTTATGSQFECRADATVSRMPNSTLVACLTGDGLVVIDLVDGTNTVVLPRADSELRFVLTSFESAE